MNSRFKCFQLNTRRSRGFTLVELLVVLAIIGILSAVAIPVYADHLDKVRTAACAAQREEIYRVFVVESLTNEEVGECKDTMELQDLLGKDPIVYLADQGYFKLEEMRCPVYDEQYKLDVSTINGVKSVQVVCPCVANENSYLAFAQKTYEEIKNVEKMSREVLIKTVYERRGSLLEVSDRMKSGTSFEKEELYWRPYYLGDGKIVMFAAAGNDSSHAKWNANLLYVDGQIYQSTALDGKKPTTTNIASLYSIKADALDDWLAGKGFEKRQ